MAKIKILIEEVIPTIEELSAELADIASKEHSVPSH